MNLKGGKMDTIPIKYDEVKDLDTFKSKLGLSDLKNYSYTSTEYYLIEYGNLEVIFASYKLKKLQYIWNSKQNEMIKIDY